MLETSPRAAAAAWSHRAPGSPGSPSAIVATLRLDEQIRLRDPEGLAGVDRPIPMHMGKAIGFALSVMQLSPTSAVVAWAAVAACLAVMA